MAAVEHDFSLGQVTDAARHGFLLLVQLSQQVLHFHAVDLQLEVVLSQLIRHKLTALGTLLDAPGAFGAADFVSARKKCNRGRLVNAQHTTGLVLFLVNDSG